MTRSIKVTLGVAAVALLMVSNSMAGGPVPFDFDNTASQVANFGAPLYAHDQTTPLGVGDVVQLIAFNGSGITNILSSGTIGGSVDNLSADVVESFIPNTAGYFDFQGVVVASNVLQGIQSGFTLGIRFYDATSVPGASWYGVISSPTAMPTPDYTSPPTSPTTIEPDTQNGGYVGPLTGGSPGFGPGQQGFYANLPLVPEPSTFVLVGLGVLGALGMSRRRRS